MVSEEWDIRETDCKWQKPLKVSAIYSHILISHTAKNFFLIPHLSPQLKFLNYYSQCQMNCHNFTTSQLHYLGQVQTISPSSFRIWQTFLSPKTLPIKIQTGIRLATSEKTWPTEILALKFLAYFKFDHYWPNVRAARPSSSFSSLIISISPSFCHLQSAYRKSHSTETILLK